MKLPNPKLLRPVAYGILLILVFFAGRSCGTDTVDAKVQELERQNVVRQQRIDSLDNEVKEREFDLRSIRDSLAVQDSLRHINRIRTETALRRLRSRKTYETLSNDSLAAVASAVYRQRTGDLNEPGIPRAAWADR